LSLPLFLHISYLGEDFDCHLGPVNARREPFYWLDRVSAVSQGKAEPSLDLAAVDKVTSGVLADLGLEVSKQGTEV
jgi:hypothetical protein